MLTEGKHLIEVLRIAPNGVEMFHGACPEQVEGFNMTQVTTIS
jgi:hypothetical protein